MRLCVIDIGTNSIHMILAEIRSDLTFEVLSREKEMTRLGDGTLKTGFLSSEVMERGLQTIRKFYRLAKSKGVQKMIATATSAVREAQNGGEFIEKIFKETSIRVEVITGEEEGRLIYLGVKNSLQLKKGNSLIFDIGGGSVEILLVNRRRIILLKSLKLGCARLRDLFLQKNETKGLKSLEKYVNSQLRSFLPAFKKSDFVQAIATSGTFNNLTEMALSLKKGAKNRFPAEILKFGDLEKLYFHLQQLSPNDRMKIKGVDPQRKDLILSGAAVAYLILKFLKVPEVYYCDAAIREGIIYNYIERHRSKIKIEEEIPNVRRRNILKLAQKCHYPQKHSEQVAKLSLQIFDQTQKLHELGETERELLEYASLLHDIGYLVGFEKHHRHTFYLIKNGSLSGFTQEEIDLLALAARYHRRSIPKKSHLEFSNLNKSLQKKIEWLAAILRIADALDRSHFSVIKKIRFQSDRKRLAFHLSADHDIEYEVWEAKRKGNLLSTLSKKEIDFIHKK